MVTVDAWNADERPVTYSTAVEEIQDGSAVAAPRLAAIQRTYEEERARIADPARSADAAPASTDPGPEDAHEPAWAGIADMARCAQAPPASADAGGDTKKIYLRALRPLSACAGTRPERHTASRPAEPAARAGLLTRILRQLSPVGGDDVDGT